MRRMAFTTTILIALAATPALAQSAADARAMGLRTLSWPGKPAAVRPAAPAQAAPVPVEVAAPAPAPSPVPTRTETRYSGGPASAPAPRANGLTPASAFYGPPAAAAYAPTPYAAAPAPAPAPTYRAEAPPPPPIPSPAPAPVRAAAADPMAPRADAFIHRMGTAPAAELMPDSATAPRVQPSATPGATATGARYYSVHRAAGREPDVTPLPAPFFLDAAPVDLAQPPEPPVQQRRNGLNPIVADGVDLP